MGHRSPGRCPLPDGPDDPDESLGASTSCLAPADFFLSVGFKTVRQHPRFPRLRLDLRGVLSWRDDVELAVERWLGAIRPTVIRPEQEAGPAGAAPRVDP